MIGSCQFGFEIMPPSIILETANLHKRDIALHWRISKTEVDVQGPNHFGMGP